MRQKLLGTLPVILCTWQVCVGGRCFEHMDKPTPEKPQLRTNYIFQRDIPLVITTSGKYKLAETVFYKGTGNAITIRADGVKLSLGAFSLKLADRSSAGIYVDSVSDFLIDSDAIATTTTTNAVNGIFIFNSRKGRVCNVLTANTNDGLQIDGSADIQIQKSRFFNASDAGARVHASSAVTFAKCVFDGGDNGLVFYGENKNCTISGCTFPSANFSNLLVQQMDGMFVQDCSFTNTTGDPAKLNLVQFGDAAPEQACHDILMKNCTLINRPAHTPVLGNTAPEGLGIYQGSGFLVESCLIDIDNTNQDPAADLSGIHISNPGLGTSGVVASNVIIRNCVVQGLATDGFYPDIGSTGVVIEGCLATGALKDGIFLAGTSASTVAGNTVVSNGTNGIFLGEASVSNTIKNNIVNSNGFTPISTSLLPLGNGISIASDSSKNIVQGNEVFNNSMNGISDQGTGNQIWSNSAYANGTKNYDSAVDIIITSTPGSSTLTAGNVTT